MIKRRRKPRLLKIIFLLFFTFILLASGLFFCFRFLTIKEVNISMNKIDCTTDDQFRKVAAIDGQNFLFFDGGKIIKDIKEKFICIKNITFSRSFPNKIKAEVIPRIAVAELITIEDQQASPSSMENISTPSAEAKTDSFLADDEGMVFSKNINNFNIPKLYLYNSKISLGQASGVGINDALKILFKIKTFGVDADKSWIKDNFLIIDTTSKSRIIFKLNDKVDIQIASLQLILAEAKINHRTIPTEPGIDSNKLEFIDLRFDKPIVRFAPKKP